MKISDITVKQALIIGGCQSVAMIPGVSRSLATILGGLSLGLNRKLIVQFSFLLAIPTMLAATLFDLAKSAPVLHPFSFTHPVGIYCSFLWRSSALSSLCDSSKHNFIPFGIYRSIVSLIYYLI